MPDIKFGAVGLNNVIYTAQNTAIANNTSSNSDGGFGISEEEKAQLLAELDKFKGE